MTSNSRGRNIIVPAIIPNAPTPDFNNLRHPLTLERASFKALPTIGTKLSIKNLVPCIFKLSISRVTTFCIVSTPTNITDKNFTIFLMTLFIKLHKFSKPCLEDIDEIIDIPNVRLANGITKFEST